MWARPVPARSGTVRLDEMGRSSAAHSAAWVDTAGSGPCRRSRFAWTGIAVASLVTRLTGPS